MQRKSERHHIHADECPIAQALAEIGDEWILLILREAMYGTRRFDDFQRQLGIARNILSTRLKRMVEYGLLIKRSDEQDRRSHLYILTAKGRDVWPLLMGLTMWSNQWITEDDKQPVVIKNQTTGRSISRICAVDDDGRIVELKDTILEAGPGASEAFRQQIEAIKLATQGESDSR